MAIELPPGEGLILKRRAILGPDDSDDKTVTILNRLVTWICFSGSRATRLRLKPTRAIERSLLAQTNLDGTNVKSVTTPAMKMQEWTPQMLTKIDKDRASTFKCAAMRASFMSINRVHVQLAVKEVACLMAEPSEGARTMLKRSVSMLCGSRHRASDLRTEVRQGAARGY